MSAPTPIKRSKELAPLSREHHDGLLFVYKIRQGLKLHISKDRIASFCAWNWNSRFDLHFKKEENSLVPVLGEAHAMIKRMLEEHQTIRQLFAGINHDADVAAFENLAKNINDHIRFEERQLFPLIEQTASPQRLKAIEQSLADEQPDCSVWADEFWMAPR